eukprot:14320281-Alexandrium_andersonii.AAC.1
MRGSASTEGAADAANEDSHSSIWRMSSRRQLRAAGSSEVSKLSRATEMRAASSLAPGRQWLSAKARWA